MPTRSLVLALLLAPLLLFGGAGALRLAGTEPLMPAVDAAAVVRVEIARGREQVVLAKRQDTGAWEILSAADAPGDAARIEAAIDRLAGLRGRPLAANAPLPRREPLQVRLTDRSGAALGHAAFWTGEGQALPNGARLSLPDPPALPLWPSAWTSLVPPRIAAADVVGVHRLSGDGKQPLGADAVVAVGEMLAGLSARDFMGGAQLSWFGARQLRVDLADGSSIDLQQVPDGGGRYFLRMTSDRRTDVRAARRYAFRVAESLP